jgi:hypothetical protein
MLRTKKYLAMLCFCASCVMGYAGPSAADDCDNCMKSCQANGGNHDYCGIHTCSGSCWTGGGE